MGRYTFRRSLNWAKRQSKLLAAALGGVVIGGSAVAFAVIPDANGVIHGCYRSSGALANGSLRIIDSPAQTCNSNETALSWNQTGPQGPVGPQGPPGPAGSSYFGLPFICSDCDLTGSGGLLAGKDLSGAWMRSNEFADMDLTNTDLSGATLQFSTFSGSGINFDGTDFTNANMDSVRFISGSFDLRNALLTGITGLSSLNNTNVSGVDFTDANMAAVAFNNVNATNANFTNVSFVNAGIDNTDLTGANFTGSDVSQTFWTNVTCPDGTNSDNNGNTCVGHLTP
jgi:uncharacterized protein YjbI with pentapeptide repeats